MNPRFFRTQYDFRKWLEEHHSTATEIFVGFYKVSSGKKCMTYAESVDQALCFGWIDGVRRTIDADSYMNRFTPRKASSNWSAVNIRKAEQLIKDGAMEPAGLAAFMKRDMVSGGLSDEFQGHFKASPTAYSYFEGLPNWYKEQKVKWVMGAKQQGTRQSRLQRLIDACQREERI